MSNKAREFEERLRMTVEMTVTPAQALALQAMFEYWNTLSRLGASREVGFYVDGDGSFHPEVQVHIDRPLPDLTNELRRAAVSRDSNGNRLYDFDTIAGKLRDRNMARHEGAGEVGAR